MIDQYQDYINEPRQEKIASLFEALRFCPDDLRQNLLDIYLSSPEMSQFSSTLTTNGTTWKPVNYQFGPSFSSWRFEIETFLVDPKQEARQIVQLKSRLLTGLSGNIFRLDPKRQGISLDFNFGDLAVDYLLDAVHEIKNKVCLVVKPRDLLFLSRHDRFLDQAAAAQLSFANTDSEMFCDTNAFSSRGVFVNDQMIDWSSGKNFYTCEHGKRHTLVNLWAERNGRTYNLVNLADKNGVVSSDVLHVTKEPCQCGAAFCVTSFFPRREHLPVVDNKIVFRPRLPYVLKHRYVNLQFLECRGTLHCAAICPEGLEREAIEHELGCQIDTSSSDIMYMVGGRKTPAFVGSSLSLVRFQKQSIL